MRNLKRNMKRSELCFNRVTLAVSLKIGCRVTRAETGRTVRGLLQ